MDLQIDRRDIGLYQISRRRFVGQSDGSHGADAVRRCILIDFDGSFKEN